MKIAALILGLAVFGGGVVGCDKKEAEEVHKVENSDGSKAHDQTTVKRDNDGTVTKTHEEKVTPPQHN